MIIIRADGNKKIGAGHIMRCLSIASIAKDMGENCKFILSSDDFKDLVVKNGFQVEVLDSDYSVLNHEEITDKFKSDKLSAVIVDSYYVNEEFMTVVHNRCKDSDCKLVYIDDRCSNAYSCDIVVNYNISAVVDDYRTLYEGKTIPLLLIGTAYVPLRKEFHSFSKRSVSIKADHIFVSTGGADPEHFALVLLDEAKKHERYSFHFVVGMMNPDKEAIRDSALEQSNIIIHENVSEMGNLMRKCDVAISASGSTLYELCATQTPTITYILADNQIPLADKFDKSGIISNLGDIRITDKIILASNLISGVVKLAENYDERVRIADAMMMVTDGNGARRIVEKIIN